MYDPFSMYWEDNEDAECFEDTDSGDFPRDDDQSESLSSESQCHTCLDRSSSGDVYRCKTCLPDLASKQHKNVETAHDKHFYCKICIVGHLRRKHEIVDHKGYEPALCEKHRNICQFFCKTCQILFCPDCIASHSSHTFQILEEKENQVRAKVFECITTNEELAKPLNHKQAITETCLKEKSRLRNSLGFFEINDTLREAYKRVIRSGTYQLKDSFEYTFGQTPKTFEQLESVNKESNEKNIQLKQLLQMSAGNMVKFFIASQAEFENATKDQQEHLRSHTFLQWTEDLDALIASSIEKMLETIKMPAIENIQMEELKLVTTVKLPRTEKQIKCAEVNILQQSGNNAFWSYTDELFGLKISQDKCSFSLLTGKNKNLSIQNFVLTDVQAKHIFATADFVAICTTTDTVIIYGLQENKFIQQFKLDKKCIPLSIISRQNGAIACLAWFSQSSSLKFTPKTNEELRLPAKPRLMSHFPGIYSFVYFPNQVKLWKRGGNLQMDISKLQHGLSSVDNMKLADSNTVFLFDYKLHWVVKFTFALEPESPRNCSIEKVLKISMSTINPTKLITVICGKIIACSSNENMHSADLPHWKFQQSFEV